MNNNNNMSMPMYMDYEVEGLELAQAYIPYQPYVGMVPLEEALKRGSLFPNLYKPYVYKENKESECK